MLVRKSIHSYRFFITHCNCGFGIQTRSVASLGDSLVGMMSVMGEHSISQMPGGGPDGALVGLLEEVDLLNHLLDHEGFALLVVKDGRPVGILTKIDVLDYVAGKVESLDPKVLVNL